MDRKAYFDALDALPVRWMPSDDPALAMSHTTWNPTALKGIFGPFFGPLRASPCLLSRKAVAAGLGQASRPAKAHEVPSDIGLVFCFLGSRTKHVPQTTQSLAILVLNLPEPNFELRARPFDSGGINRALSATRTHGTPMDDAAIRLLVGALTFDAPWLDDFERFRSRLFNDAKQYHMGETPSVTDPLNLPPHDPFNFTWEVLQAEQLPLDKRLLGVFDVRFADFSSNEVPNASIISSQIADALLARQQGDRIKYQQSHLYDTSDDATSRTVLQKALYQFCIKCDGLPGW